MKPDIPSKLKALPLIPTAFLFAITLAINYFSASWLMNYNIQAGVLITEFVFFLAWPLALIATAGVSFKSSLVLNRTSAGALLLPLLLIPSLTMVLSQYMALQEAWFPTPPAYFSMIRSLIGNPDNALKIVWLVFVVAVVPGVCEEVLFRGILLSSLRSKLPSGWAILITAVVFGAFHFNPHRFIPITAIGLVLGILTVKSGSIFPAMIGHVINNGQALIAEIVLGREFAGMQQSPDWFSPIILIVSGFFLLAALRICFSLKPNQASAAASRIFSADENT